MWAKVHADELAPDERAQIEATIGTTEALARLATERVNISARELITLCYERRLPVESVRHTLRFVPAAIDQLATWLAYERRLGGKRDEA